MLSVNMVEKLANIILKELNNVIGEVNNGIILETDIEKNIADTDNKLSKSDNGRKVDKTIENFKIILENDKHLNKHIQYNMLSHRIEHVEFNENDELVEVRGWSDTDESAYIDYIESTYDLYDEKKYERAFKIVARNKAYHPIKDLIEDGEWDGVKRIDRFLKDILKCDGDDIYLREVSRMIFYGGISRIYEPGIKFDYMPVLSGKQGIGKSTIISWLALNHSYYKEVTTIKDKEGIECIQGGWICEFSELMAFRGNNNNESLKAFITRQIDRCRMSYDHYVSEFPRTCIFIGTTNEVDYLNDETGNRRFLPLNMTLDVGELYKNEEDIKEYISQCWKEALELYRKGEIYLTIPKEHLKLVADYQNSAMVEDVKLQAVESYLDEKEIGYRLCTYEIAIEVFGKLRKDVNKADSKIIMKYMLKQDNWVYKSSTYLPDYGNQRYWQKVAKSNREIKKDMEEL